MKARYVFLYVISLSCFFNEVNAQDSWKVDSARVVFHINNAGLTVTGSIAGVAGDIKFSKKKVGKSSFTATAKSETVRTGISLRDKHLRKADYFDVEHYPTIKITSNQVTELKDSFEAKCSITIKDQTRDINIPFTFTQTNGKGEFKGSFSLNRLDFGLGEKSFVLSDEVRIEIWIGASLVSN
jgi:polyisoprenoid-binding protein YceI